MAGCYSGDAMKRHPLPDLWLLSDARNDAALDRALRRLPRGSGFVFRHYHLPPAARRARYEALHRICRSRGHLVILAGSRAQARSWRADGSYGPRGHVTTAHGLAELRRATRAAAVMLSPVHPTRSHPGAAALGGVRFRLLAALAPVPAIALGGMDNKRARQLRVRRWAAIDGLSCP